LKYEKRSTDSYTRSPAGSTRKDAKEGQEEEITPAPGVTSVSDTGGVACVDLPPCSGERGMFTDSPTQSIHLFQQPLRDRDSGRASTGAVLTHARPVPLVR
jgi:hypothetical protein